MRDNGFSLVELLIVIVIVAVLSTVVMFQITNSPKGEARDAIKKNDINKIADAYDLTALEGNSYRPVDGPLPKPPEGGEYQGLLSSVSGEYFICAQLEKGKDINCLENSGNPQCYCRSSRGYDNNGNGNGGGGATPSSSSIPTPTPSPSATPLPTPAVNPFGQSIAFNGKIAGKNPPSYTPIPEYVRASYSSVMNLPSNNVTVEAWIKPNVPTDAGYHYRIVDNTYRLTMDARPNGTNISYLYYFDVQSSPYCGQTVVYSGGGNGYDPNNLGWFNESHYKTVSQSDFAQWRHIAGVLQNGNLHIYENGVKLNSYNVGMNVCNDSRSLHIGAGLFGKNTPYYDYFQGQIDEVRISDVARYTSNFTVPNLPFTPDANTDMLYHFDGNTTDSSSNGLNGAITGTTEYVESTIPY